MSSFKEIVTKAVIGKAKKTNRNAFNLVPEQSPNTILGCWVINHTFSGNKGLNGNVNVNGAFDVNVWYSYDSDKKTAVSTQTFNYTDSLHVPLRENAKIDSSSEIIVRCLKQPTVANVKIDKGNVVLDIEKEMGVEVIGDTKVKVSVEDDFDDYDEIIDDEDVDEVMDNIDENYLETEEKE